MHSESVSGMEPLWLARAACCRLGAYSQKGIDLRLEDIDRSIDQYEEVLTNFDEGYGLHVRSLGVTAERFLIVCASEVDYLETCVAMDEMIDPMLRHEVVVDGRMTTTAQMSAQERIGGFSMSLMRIVAPRPEEALFRGYFADVEVCAPDLFRIEQRLQLVGVDQFVKTTDSDSGDSRIVLPIDDAGRTLTFNETSLVFEQVVDEIERLLSQEPGDSL